MFSLEQRNMVRHLSWGKKKKQKPKNSSLSAFHFPTFKYDISLLLKNKKQKQQFEHDAKWQTKLKLRERAVNGGRTGWATIQL